MTLKNRIAKLEATNRQTADLLAIPAGQLERMYHEVRLAAALETGLPCGDWPMERFMTDDATADWRQRHGLGR